VLTITKVSSRHASSYYTADTPGGQLAHSRWQGNISKALALSGNVDPAPFERLLNGWTPGDDRQSMVMARQPNRIAAIDATFSAPKSISIEALVNGNTELIAAHREAVAFTIATIEQEAQARIRDKYKRSRFIETNQLAIAKFDHLLSRMNDPQLHTHSLIINVTKVNNQWRSWYSRRLFQKIKEYGSLYREKLAENVCELGYSTRKSDRGLWELTSVPAHHIALFSKRSQQIVSLTNNHLTIKQKAVGKLIDRPSKQEKNLDELQKEWYQAISAVERSALVRQR